MYNFQHRPVWDGPCEFSGWTFDMNKILCKFGDWRRGFSWHRCTCCQQLSRQKLFVFGLCLQSALILILWLPLVSAQRSHASGRCSGNPLGAPWAVKLRVRQMEGSGGPLLGSGAESLERKGSRSGKQWYWYRLAKFWTWWINSSADKDLTFHRLAINFHTPSTMGMFLCF